MMRFFLVPLLFLLACTASAQVNVQLVSDQRKLLSTYNREAENTVDARLIG
jgi:hypothetical protein